MKNLVKQKELPILIAAIVVLNIPLLFGWDNRQWIFLAERVWAGQWYRLLTASFVHVGLYHLVLDGLAFVMLYCSLPYASMLKRLLSLGGIHAAVIVGVTLFNNRPELGYCGLSGIAHGLMTLWCLEMIQNPQHGIRQAGWIGLSVTAAKCAIEAVSGQALLTSWHLGNVGVPVVSSHWGGMLGAIAVFGLIHLKWRLGQLSNFNTISRHSLPIKIKNRINLLSK